MRRILTADFRKKYEISENAHTHNDEQKEITMEVFLQKVVKKAKKDPTNFLRLIYDNLLEPSTTVAPEY